MFQAVRLGGESPGQEEADKEGQKGQRGRGRPDGQLQCGGFPGHGRQACFGHVESEGPVNVSGPCRLEAEDEGQELGSEVWAGRDHSPSGMELARCHEKVVEREPHFNSDRGRRASRQHRRKEENYCGKPGDPRGSG